ncbi:hypothetical protein [Corynebacterium glyciniphilum]|uniref:hypothetical protein n=1 Tax=Corynebacterium glyciniphilum TaxID=1404244 RepID=UPI0011AB84F7|nr:hypothetical protein [Corynebacterium glyciniphilum]
MPATAEDVSGEEVKTAVMIDGEEHSVKISDPRLLEMMNIIGEEATEEEPLEILEAAAEAGIELESYGEMLEDPTKAKAGDVVISTKGSGFYLGKGEVLLESGEVVPLSEVLELRPPQSGIFRLELPELPDEVDHGDGEEPEETAASEPSEGDEAPPTEESPAGEPPSSPQPRRRAARHRPRSLHWSRRCCPTLASRRARCRIRGLLPSSRTSTVMGSRTTTTAMGSWTRKSRCPRLRSL